MSEDRTCNDCKFAVFIDDGYSNYTVEGTTFNCARKLQKSFDRWYGEDKRLDFAKECSGFETGSCINMDVDRENLSELTDDQREIWNSLNE